MADIPNNPQSNPPGSQVNFLDLSDTALTATEIVNLSTIVKPSILPLPGTEGVLWKTPRNKSPDLEFGDGVSAVFKSLSVASPSPSRPSVPLTTHPTLSASSSPFVPSISSHSIPIPLPAMGTGQGQTHPQTIHINNFTANLNYHGMQGMPNSHHNPQDNQDSPVNSYPGHNGTPQPIPFAHGTYPQQYVAPFPNGPAHMHNHQTPPLYAAEPGHSPHHQFHHPAHPGMVFVTLPSHHGHPYHGPQIVQQRPRDDPHHAVANGGITFGSTPVVSIRNGKRNSETDEVHSEDKVQSQPYSPIMSNSQFRNVTADLAASPPAQNVPPQQATPAPPPQQQAAPVPQAKQGPVEAVVQSVPKDQVIDQTKAGPKKSEAAKLAPAPSSTPSPQISKECDSSQKTQSEPVKHIKPASVPAPQLSTPQATPIISKSPKAQSEPVKAAPQTPAEAPKHAQVEPEPTKPVVDVSPAPAGPVGSWASLFQSKATNSISDSSSKPMARIPPFSASDSLESQSPKEVNSAEKELGNYLNSYALKHVSTALLPRGLTNRSNWCFVNAILQALLACPPFYNMMKNLSTVVVALKSQKSKTPMLDSIVEFISEFSVLEQMNKNQKKDKNRKKEDIVTGIGLEPSYVYKMLLNLEEDTFKVVDGRQEDAEEFLTCLLNGLSDEMLSMMKLAVEQPAVETVAAATNDAPAEEASEDWQEVGAKGKSCVTRRVTNASHVQTPIQSLALGMCRSCVKSESGDNSATLQPFYTLQLDIQDQAIQSVTDALGQNFANEKLDGFICSKTKKEIDATRTLSLEELPPILILHLKRFVYDGKTGGVQKIMKQIEFGVDLEISKNILSAECRTSPKQRQYKLFGVVYHNGREATKGHYVTDIYHTGYATWLHCDDSIVQPTAEQLVVTPSASSTPYLLFYRRGDTMVGMEKKN